MAGTDKRRSAANCCRTPLVDVFETAEAVKLQFEMPGVSRDDIDISVEEDTLTVTSKAEIREIPQQQVLVQEFESANFSREFILSRDLDRDRIEATWQDGVLTLSVPKAAAARPRKIEISAGQ